MKVIFLDVDGVLNSIPWFKSNDKTNGHNFPLGHLDPAALAMLGEIVEATSSKIVISSSWRKLYRPDEIGEMFSKKGFKYSKAIIGQTARMSQRGWERGWEIDDWVLNNHPNKYVIIDDDSDMLDFQKPFFIHTSFKTGLTPEHVGEAISKLNS